mmetsp:Transcript_54787/g.133987  ORF Transcript_54787/g.133987 Transcript_54787/m.133987 type:complete len:210 (+) Transcript_54787:185-814(+)
MGTDPAATGTVREARRRTGRRRRRRTGVIAWTGSGTTSRGTGTQAAGAGTGGTATARTGIVVGVTGRGVPGRMTASAVGTGMATGATRIARGTGTGARGGKAAKGARTGTATGATTGGTVPRGRRRMTRWIRASTSTLRMRRTRRRSCASSARPSLQNTRPSRRAEPGVGWAPRAPMSPLLQPPRLLLPPPPPPPPPLPCTLRGPMGTL